MKPVCVSMKPVCVPMRPVAAPSSTARRAGIPALGALVWVACAAGEEPKPVATAAPSVAAELAQCGLASELRVTSATGAGANCRGNPVVGDIVRLDADRLDIGGARLVRRTGSGAGSGAGTIACAYEFAGCHSDKSTWLSVGVAIQGGAGTPRMTLVGNQVRDHKGDACPGVVAYTLEPVPAAKPGACSLLGEWIVAAELKPTVGACSYTWPPGAVTITAHDGKTELEWPGEPFGFVLQVDMAACRATGAPDSLLEIHNGVARTKSLQFQRTGDVLVGTVRDKLDGKSDTGDTCDATFAFTAHKASVAAAAAAAGSGLGLSGDVTTVCGPRPFVCGDGQCAVSAGEGCLACAADCLCPSQSVCRGQAATPGLCLRPCIVKADDCGDGARCVPFGPDDGSGDSGAYCVPEGPGTTASPCAGNRDCKRGLDCWLDGFYALDWAKKGVCAPACTKACPAKCRDNLLDPTAQVCPLDCARGKTGQCPTGSFCFDKYGAWQFSQFGGEPIAPTCAALPTVAPSGPGAKCVSNFQTSPVQSTPCADGLTCINGGTCTMACNDHADCAARSPKLGTCNTTWFGPTKWCSGQ